MLRKGTTFIRSGHVWFSISEPTAANPQILFVNLTTLDDDCADDECEIDHTEYKWVKVGHRTAVAFSRAKCWDAKNVIKAFASGVLQKPDQGDVPAATVAKVVRAAVKSCQLSKNLKSML